MCNRPLILFKMLTTIGNYNIFNMSLLKLLIIKGGSRHTQMHFRFWKNIKWRMNYFSKYYGFLTERRSCWFYNDIYFIFVFQCTYFRLEYLFSGNNFIRIVFWRVFIFFKSINLCGNYLRLEINRFQMFLYILAIRYQKANTFK